MFGQQALQNDILDERFVLRERVGNGRMSSVYRASDSAFGDAEVAVKILNTAHPDEIKRTLFERETNALKRLSHPNIVGLRHRGWSDSESAFYLVLDYLPYSLDRYLNGDRSPQYGNIEPYRVMRELAEAVSRAHSEGIVHRDIKPSNILFDENGRPMVADFGISKLMTDLTVGETLAGYWSGGYASPEQRAGKPADTSSDIYSLGALFFHMLSGQTPPHEGPTQAMVDRDVNGPPPLRNLLKRMLATDPEDRPASGRELMSGLEVARRLETLPRYSLILTRTAIHDIVSAGYSLNNDFQSIADALIEDLGGMEADEVHVQLDNRAQGDVIILGDSLRLICVPNETSDALVVKTAQVSYIPGLDAQRGQAMPVRAMWEPVMPGSRAGGDAHALANMLAELSTHRTVGSVKRERRESRREFVERWNQALSGERNRIKQSAATLVYTRVEETPDYLRFTLAKPPSDDLDWEEDAPLAVRESDRSRLAPVGDLVQIQGGVVEVARQSPRRGAKNASIPRSGLITLNQIEALSANSRQREAVRAFLYGGMANPKLADAITDPSTATSSPQTELEYFQDWLSDDKKNAVSKAIASNELFLIQGPPGTGKTSVIAEIVLQILRREPAARILLASQSNVAVDHALAQIANAAGDSPPEMVRIGRPEKIASDGQAWTLEGRAKTLRQEAQSKCEPVIEEMRRSERRLRSKIKASSRAPDADMDDTATIEEWIGEAKEIAAQLKEYRQEYSMIGASASDDVKQNAADTVEYAKTQLRSQLEALNELLPQPVAIGDVDEEAALDAIIRAAAASGDDAVEEDPDARELRRIQGIRKALAQWIRVVGLTGDFQDLIGRSARVVGATCLFSGKTFGGRQRGETSAAANRFDWAIVDEAGRATLPEMLVPIIQSERIIMVGDERQLPPMVDEMLKEGVSETDGGDSLDTSLFQSLAKQMEGGDGERIASLRTQYRMRPEIGSLVSEVFYEGGLENGLRTRNRRRRNFDWMPAPVTWLSTSSLPNKAETRSGDSYANSAEAGVILVLLEKMEDKWRGRRQRPTVGVITGYSGQVERLNSVVEPENREKWRNLRIEIATVDSFQGRECDAVIYSTVRSNSAGNIGFLRDHRRVNVALSRARDMLAIVGDNAMMQSALTGSALNPFGQVLNYIQSHSDECKIVHSDMVRFL